MANELITSEQLGIFGNRVKHKLDNLSPSSSIVVGGFSNSNLLDNWYFLDPINQKEITEYSGNSVGIDRWHTVNIDSGYKYVFQKGLCNRTQTSSGKNPGILQYVEPHKISVGTYTISCLSDSGIYGYSVYSEEKNENIFYKTFDNPQSFVYDTFDNNYIFTDDSKKVVVSFLFKEAASVIDANYIKAVKLENGAVQTLAKQDSQGNWVFNDNPPNRELELVKCFPYMYVLKSSSFVIAPTIRRNATELLSFVTCPMPLNDSPVMSFGDESAWKLVDVSNSIHGSFSFYGVSEFGENNDHKGMVSGTTVLFYIRANTRIDSSLKYVLICDLGMSSRFIELDSNIKQS